jgi:hypothetical protein
MPTINPVRLSTLKVIDQLGVPSDRLFQTIAVREHLGYETSSDEAHAMHAVISDLKKKGIIRAHDTGRHRNQYLQVAGPAALQEEITREEARLLRANERRARTEAKTGTGAPAGLSALTRDVAAIAARLAHIEELLTDVLDQRRHEREPLAPSLN